MARFPLVALIPVGVFGLVAGVFMVGMLRENPDALPSALQGNSAPSVTAPALAGYPGFDREVLKLPGVKLVNFWASWCAPCRAEHPTLTGLSNSGVPIYGINYRDDPKKAVAFLEELGNPYTGVVTDDNARAAIDWGVYGVPETFVIDGEGRIVLRFAGPVTQRSLESTMQAAIDKARQ